MRLELNEDKEIIESDIAGDVEKGSEQDRIRRENYSSVSEEIKDQREKFSELSSKEKIEYIYDYYKWWIVGPIALIIVLCMLIRTVIDNKRPTYLDVEMINSYFAVDETNTVEEDFVKEYNVDLETYHLYIGTSISLSEEAFDTTMIANQQRLVGLYSAGQLDVIIGPVETMEGAANCNAYADLTNIIPQDLMDELVDREYEFYYFDPSKDEIDDYGEVVEPYFAGIYLDNCSYLNNNGQYGAYPVATEEKNRPIFTMAANAPHPDHAMEFLRFLIDNR